VDHGHDSGFARLRKKQEVEEEERKKMGKDEGSSQKDDLEALDGADFDLSHTAPEEDQDTVGARRTCWIKRWWMLRMPC
jgi:hypothetical protein